MEASPIELYWARSFLSDLDNGIVEHTNQLSKPQIVQEHGWFAYVDLFTQICESQGLLAVQDAGNTEQRDEVFNAWISAVLLILATHYTASWCPNYGYPV